MTESGGRAQEGQSGIVDFRRVGLIPKLFSAAWMIAAALVSLASFGTWSWVAVGLFGVSIVVHGLAYRLRVRVEGRILFVQGYLRRKKIDLDTIEWFAVGEILPRGIAQ